jgi:hypothetical protein
MKMMANTEMDDSTGVSLGRAAASLVRPRVEALLQEDGGVMVGLSWHKAEAVVLSGTVAVTVGVYALLVAVTC